MDQMKLAVSLKLPFRASLIEAVAFPTRMLRPPTGAFMRRFRRGCKPEIPFTAAAGLEMLFSLGGDRILLRPSPGPPPLRLSPGISTADFLFTHWPRILVEHHVAGAARAFTTPNSAEAGPVFCY